MCSSRVNVEYDSPVGTTVPESDAVNNEYRRNFIRTGSSVDLLMCAVV